MKRKVLTRRGFVAASAAASATLISAPFVRTAHAAGKLSIGFWDHWVPGANDVSRALGDGVGRQGEGRPADRLHHLAGREAAADDCRRVPGAVGPRHLQMASWWPHAYAKSLEPVDDVVSELIKQNGAIDDTVTFLGRADKRWVAVPATTGSQIKGPCSRIDLMKQHAGIDVQAHVPGRQPAQGRRTGRSIRSSRPRKRATRPGSRSASDSAPPPTSSTPRRCLPLVRRHARRRQREDHGQERRGAPGARLLQAAGPVLPARLAVLGRCLQQQVAGVGQGRLDHEPAERLGGGQARRAQDRRATVDARHAGRAQGTLRALHPQLLGDLELQQEQVSRQEPAGAPVDAVGDREAGGGQRRLRRAVLQEPDRRSRSGPRKGRRRARCTTTPTPTTIRCCRSRRRPRRPRSPSRSTPRAS